MEIYLIFVACLIPFSIFYFIRNCYVYRTLFRANRGLTKRFETEGIWNCPFDVLADYGLFFRCFWKWKDSDAFINLELYEKVKPYIPKKLPKD